MATLTVKGVQATAEQARNIQLCCQIAKQMGATPTQIAGAIATMTTESTCRNLPGGDRDSAGLYQQRPSCNWGSYAQVTDPVYAIKAFLTPYLGYCRKGMGVIAAANATQGSAFPTGPASWLAEASKDVGIVMGSQGFADTTSLGIGAVAGISSSTRIVPYEFSRGNAGKKETSWDCMGRLAQEVGWDRFMRAGTLWFVSEEWLKRQTPRFAFAEGARGVLAITFTTDTRRHVAEATVSAVARRWAVLPGDVVTVSGEGAGDGLWLVISVRRSIASAVSEIMLRRPAPKLGEPANQTASTTNTVAGMNTDRLGASSITGGATAGSAKAQDIYNLASALSAQKYPYVWGGGHAAAGHADRGTGRDPGIGYDCSGSVGAVLAAAGCGYQTGSPIPGSGTMAASWGIGGRGRWVTMWASSEHVWLQFTGVGPMWRFDTSPWNCGDPNGPRMRPCARSTSGFTPRHWPGT